MTSLRRTFKLQRNTAGFRGIPFTMTFEQWHKLWLDSGKLTKRGRKRGQYVMARIGDKGPYAIGNVKIVESSANRSEGWLTCNRVARIKKFKASRTRHFYTYQGRTHSTAEWARMLGLKNATIIQRIKYGMSPEQVLFKGKLERRDQS